MNAICTTCTRDASAPYRRVLNGVIVEGCIDRCHGPHLREGTPDHDWHFRAEAMNFRDGIRTGRTRALSPKVQKVVDRLNGIDYARTAARTHARSALYWARDARRNMKRADVDGALVSLRIAGQDRELAREYRAELARLEAT